MNDTITNIASLRKQKKQTQHCSCTAATALYTETAAN